MSSYEHMSDDYLRNNYRPDVYQLSIYSIDYKKLKAKGISLISFDIDDTIVSLENFKGPSKNAITLFENLKSDGFTIVLLTNAGNARARRISRALGVGYVSDAEKPSTDSFKTIMSHFDLKESQMAHVGNSLRYDVAGGNVAGITTCLVRRKGLFTKMGHKLSKTKKLEEELKARKIWCKHHVKHDNDQYYQFGETPAYLRVK